MTGWETKVADGLAFLRRRLSGEYEVDEFGYDAEFTHAVLAPPARALFEKWFRATIKGISHIPATGSALIVANHAGVLPIDATMLAVGVHDHHPRHRMVRFLAADLVFNTPILGPLARRSGATLACTADASRLLASGELVGVFPEGYKGLGKPYRERYQLQRFGRGGFVGAALAARAPIVPCAIVGSEEIYPKIADVTVLARALGLPYFPITPLFPLAGPLGMIPLPSKWMIAFGKPIDVAAMLDAGDVDPDDPMTLLTLTDEVRSTIQTMLHRLVEERGPAFG